jgi:hypothetical protein
MLSEYLPVVSIVGAIIGSVWTLAWWLSGQFSAVRSLVYDKIEKTSQAIMAQIDYHEKHDDQRFAAITNDLWEIRVRNAAKDGRPIPTQNGHHGK